MKRLIAAVLSALALVGGAAHAAMPDHGANSPYDSTTVEGDSARWGVGG